MADAVIETNSTTLESKMRVSTSLCSCVFSLNGYSDIHGAVVREDSKPAGALPGRAMESALRRGLIR